MAKNSRMANQLSSSERRRQRQRRPAIANGELSRSALELQIDPLSYLPYISLNGRPEWRRNPKGRFFAIAAVFCHSASDAIAAAFGCCHSPSMWRIVLWLLIAIFVLGATYALAISDHSSFNRAGLTGASGRIETGEKFGVSIGDDPRDIDNRFRALGFKRVELTRARSCHGFDYAEDQNLQLWLDESWRRGTLCVVSAGSKITYLSWSYGMGFP